MKISEKRYNDIYNFFLYTISATLVFRKVSTFLIILFAAFNLFFLRKLSYSKKSLYLILVIASPFILDILFFWNNDDLTQGLKSVEKRVSLLLFPLFIIGYYKRIDFYKLIKTYVLSTTVILLGLFLRYIILFYDKFQKYLEGVYSWQMGYDFANSFEMHAPALNMHISFATVLSAYLLLNRKSKQINKIVHIVTFLILFGFLLYVNTRVAMLNCLICTVFIVVYETIRKKEKIKQMLRRLIITAGVFSLLFIAFVSIYPRLLFKLSEESFSNMDKIGRLDEIERPETKVHGSLVTRLSIWKSSLEMVQSKYWTGYGASDAKRELVDYFELTNQKYLAKFKFPVHNQYIDFLLKFGILGLAVSLLYVFFIGYLGIKLHNSAIISFFFIFFISNLTDDFLIRYDGITFSGLWFSIFANQYKFKISEEN